MFWVLSLFAVGGSYVAIDKYGAAIAGLIGVMGVSYVIAVPTVWFLQVSGLSGFINESWEFLSGTTSQELGSCPPGADGTSLWSLPALLIMLAACIPALMAFLGLPIGMILLAFSGAVQVLVGDFTRALQKSLKILAFGLSGVIVAGLMFRLVDYINLNHVC